MQDQHLFQLGEKLLLVTLERQTILIDGEEAGFVELLLDRENQRTEARIWLYPPYRSLTVPVRRWIERSHASPVIAHPRPTGTGVARYQRGQAESGSPEAEWKVEFRSDRNYGYEVFLTDQLTGFRYPVHTSRSRRSAFNVRREIEQDLFVLSSDAFAVKWGLQRITSHAFQIAEER